MQTEFMASLHMKMHAGTVLPCAVVLSVETAILTVKVPSSQKQKDLWREGLIFWKQPSPRDLPWPCW